MYKSDDEFTYLIESYLNTKGSAADPPQIRSQLSEEHKTNDLLRKENPGQKN